MTAFRPEPHTALMVRPGMPLGKAGLDDRLARRVLADTGSQHLAQDDFTKLVGIEAGTLQHALDDGCAEFGCGDLGQRAAKFAHCRAAGCNDNDVFHDVFPCEVSECVLTNTLNTKKALAAVRPLP
jgi:hypothetical protein